MARFQHLHVISGPDDYRRQQAIRAVLDQLAPGENRMMNVERVTGRDLDFNKISDALQAYSLFALGDAEESRKILFVDEADQIRNEILKALLTSIDSAAARDAQDVAVVLAYSPGKDPAKAVSERAGKHHPCPALDWRTARPFVQEYAKDVHGVRLSSTVADTLLEYIGKTDAGPLAQEIDKLVLLSDGQPITEQLIIEATGQRVGRTPYNFCDAFGLRNTDEALRILADLLDGRANDANAVAGPLAYHIATLLRVRARLDQGMGDMQAASFVFPDWKRKDVIAQARCWSLSALEQAAEGALELDIGFKSGASDNGYNLISTFVHKTAAL